MSLFKGQKTLENPEYEPLESEELVHTGRLVPVYPSTPGLAARTVRRLAKEALDGYVDLLPELLPPELLGAHSLLPLDDGDPPDALPRRLGRPAGGAPAPRLR